MPPSVDPKVFDGSAEGDVGEAKAPAKLGMTSGVFIPVFLNILSILMFLRFGVILGQVGFVGMFGQSMLFKFSQDSH